MQARSGRSLGATVRLVAACRVLVTGALVLALAALAGPLTAVSQAATTGTLTGRVLADTGRALPGATVTLVQRVGEAEYDEVAWVEADADGRFAFSSVPVGPGQWYTVVGEAPEFRETYLGGASAPGTALFVEMTSARAFPDLLLTPDPDVSGEVSGPAGVVSGVDVSLYTRSPQGGWEFAASDTTDVHGRYRIPLSPGTHTLFFDPFWAEAPLQEQYLGAGHPTSIAAAETFTVGEAVVSQVRSVTLRAAPMARGRVVSNGVPQRSTAVTTYVWDAQERRWDQDRVAVTDGDGRFSTKVRSGRIMTFRFDAPGVHDPLLDGEDALPSAPGPGNAVWVDADGLPLGTVDLATPSPGFQPLLGQVLDQWGRRVPDVAVTLVRADGPWAGGLAGPREETVEDGRFGFSALPGNYLLAGTHQAGSGTCAVATIAVTLAVEAPVQVLRATCPGPPPVPPAPGPAPVPPPPASSPGPAPTAPARAAATVRLKVLTSRVTVTSRVTLMVRVRAAAGGRAHGPIQVRAGGKVVVRARVRGTTARATIRLRLPARTLGPGRHRLQAYFGGNAVTAPDGSPRVPVTVRR